MALQSNTTSDGDSTNEKNNSRTKPAFISTGTLKRQHTTTPMITDDPIRFYADEFVQIRALGEPGTFGMVYESYRKNDSHKTLYAVKRMSKRLDFFQKIKWEIDIMQKLKNPYI